MKTIEAEMEFLEKRGVEKCVMFAALGDWESGNRELKEVAERYRGKIVPFCTVNPMYRGVAENEVRKCIQEWGFKGVKLHPQVHQYLADTQAVLDLMELITKLRVPVVFHTGDRFVGDPFSRPRRFVKIAESFPDAKIIMAHMGVSDWPEVLEMAARYENLIMDTTGATITYGFVESFVDRIGAERIVWGSDVPLYDPIMAISKVKDSDISEDAKQLILGKNIARILGIKGGF
jgi:predicted TIM-barrel fold metal-dependent hydrolase